MREKIITYLIASLLLVFAFVVGVQFAQKALRQSPTPTADEATTQEYKGDINISNVNYGNFIPPVDSVALSGIKVEDFVIEDDNLGGQKMPKLTLTISFKIEGKERQLKVPIFKEIYYSKSLGLEADYSLSEAVSTSVYELPLKKGQYISLLLTFVPDKKEVKIGEIEDYWKKRDYKLGLMYLEAGFGFQPINFSQYLKNLFAKSDIQTLKTDVVFASRINI